VRKDRREDFVDWRGRPSDYGIQDTTPLRERSDHIIVREKETERSLLWRDSEMLGHASRRSLFLPSFSIQKNNLVGKRGRKGSAIKGKSLSPGERGNEKDIHLA